MIFYAIHTFVIKYWIQLMQPEMLVMEGSDCS